MSPETKGDGVVEEHPKLFMSYSWSSPEHEEWVHELAKELVESAGVDVKLDKWHLKDGHDPHVFMESMVTDPEIKKVILVCDRLYKEKADKREGGVGTEAQIISGEIYSKVQQDKFVALIVEKDKAGKAYVPAYYASRIYIDFSDDELRAKNWERLIRWIYNQPLYEPPKVGKKPAFLSESPELSLSTSAAHRIALSAIKANRQLAPAFVQEYFEILADEIEKFRITDKQGSFDDLVVASIEQFLPYRNEAIEIFHALALYNSVDESPVLLHRFFERLVPYLDRPEGVTRWAGDEFDNFRFIIHELFLHAIAVLLKYERFEVVSHLLNQRYYSKYLRDTRSAPMASFSVFRQHMSSLDTRRNRLRPGFACIRADLLINSRPTETGITQDHLMQADFILFVRSSLDLLKEEQVEIWFPHTLLFKPEWGEPFEILLRAESKTYFNKIKMILGIEDKAEFVPLLKAFEEGRLTTPSWPYKSVLIAPWMNLKNIATRS